MKSPIKKRYYHLKFLYNQKKSFEKEKNLISKNYDGLLRDYIELKSKHIFLISDSETKLLKYKNKIKQLTVLKNDYEEFIHKYNTAQQKLIDEKKKKRFSFFN